MLDKSHPIQPLSTPDFTGVEPEHLLQAMRMCENGRGDEVLARFESDFSELCGSRHALAVSSATSGLHLALKALDVKEGDEVICPTFTFAASAFPVMYEKAIPVFVDSEMDTWNMSPNYLEEAILDRKRNGKVIRAIILVHGYGTPANLDELLTIASQYDIPVVEDAANALGSTWKGKQVGAWGRIGVFSFNRNKIVSAAAGGCVVTNDVGLEKKMRYFAHQAKTQAPFYHHEAVGYNYGLSPILAEIIRVQLSSLSLRIGKRRATFEEYRKLCKGKMAGQKELKHAFANRWLTVFMPSREEERWVSSFEGRKVWKPMHVQPVFNGMAYYGNQESLHFFEKSICLPFLREPIFQA